MAADGSAVNLPMPRLIGQYDENGRGEWYAGEIPENGESRPVVVFVPGLGQPARSFWEKGSLFGTNELYIKAHADGFRTAFVSFAARDEKALDMWQDGRILAWQLPEICNYFGVDNVVLVAHSKGGVDAQTAVVQFGAARYVSRLITLSSPHWGSQLADIAYSSYGWPIAEHLKAHSDGCYVMQTGYMKEFRRVMDENPENTVPILTYGGNGGAPVFTKLWAGAQILSQYGENDGVVTVKSSHNPKGEHQATLNLNHEQMQEGKFVWDAIKPAVLGEETVRTQAQEVFQPVYQYPAVPAAENQQTVPDFNRMGGLLLRGGQLQNSAIETFSVDSTTKKFEIFLTLAKDGEKEQKNSVELVSPNGATNRNFLKVPDFMGMNIKHITVQKPAAGRWRLRLKGGSGAYLAVIRLSGVKKAEEQANLNFRDLMTTLKVYKTLPDHCELVKEQKLSTNESIAPFDLEDGVYCFETSVKGRLKDGSPYERNCLRPVVVSNDYV